MLQLSRPTNEANYHIALKALPQTKEEELEKVAYLVGHKRFITSFRMRSSLFGLKPVWGCKNCLFEKHLYEKAFQRSAFDKT